MENYRVGVKSGGNRGPVCFRVPDKWEAEIFGTRNKFPESRVEYFRKHDYNLWRKSDWVENSGVRNFSLRFRRNAQILGMK